MKQKKQPYERAIRKRLREFLELLPPDLPPSQYFGGSHHDERIYFGYSETRLIQTFLAIPNVSRSVTCLDVGTTPFTFFVKEEYPHYDVRTLDKTDRMPNRLLSYGLPLTICNLDDATLPYKSESLDVVIFTEVLEHVFAPPNRVLTEVHRVLKHGGKLIISVPNLASLVKRIRLALNFTPLQNPNIQLSGRGRGHLHEYVMREITHILQECGFRIESQRYIGLPSSYRLKRRGIVKKLAVCSLVVLESVFPSFKHHILIEAMKD